MLLPDYLTERRTAFDRLLDAALPPAGTRPAVLHEAMRYSLFCGGKRLRPILCWAACEACGAPRENADTPALALECLHTYTLIHDDLPAMDNDSLRRGQPTSHIVFGDANAILAGDALLTFAFELLARQPAPRDPLAWVRELAGAGGSQGVIAGQVEDMLAEVYAEHDPDELRYIHENKTARLISAACRMGALAAEATPTQQQALADYGRAVGMAFQFMDDVLDVTSDSKTLGKPARSDETNKKFTSVTLFGIDGAREQAGHYVSRAHGYLADFSGEATPLRMMADYCIERLY